MPEMAISETYGDEMAYGPNVQPGTFQDQGTETRRTSRSVTDRTQKEVVQSTCRSIDMDGLRTVSPSNNGMIQAGTDGIEVILVQDFTDEMLETISRWSQAAGSGAPEEIRLSKDPAEFLQGGLAFQSLEDIRVAFAVRGVSRVCTHQLVRTRAAAFKQQSQQDTWMGDMPEFRMPESCWLNPVVRLEMIRALVSAQGAYNIAIQSGVPYKDARYILPEGTTNFILCEYSLRTFIELYAYRGCVMFQQELVHVTKEMRRLLIESHPYLEPHIKISCEVKKVCTFHGPERVEEVCMFPWAREDNREYRQKNAGYDK